MKRLFPILLLAATAWAQTQSVDVLIDMHNNPAAGQLLTTTLLGGGTVGGTGTWSVTPNPLTVFKVGSVAQAPYCAFKVGGTNFAGSTSTGWDYLHDADHQAVRYTLGTAKTAVSIGFFWTTYLGSPVSYNNYDFTQIHTDTGADGSMNYADGNGMGAGGAFVVVSEDAGGGTTNLGGTIAVSRAHTYWVTQKVSALTGTYTAIFDPANNWAQVGSTSFAAAAKSSSTIQIISFGANRTGTSPGAHSYFSNIVIDYTNAVFPLGVPVLPAAPTNPNASATSGTTVTISWTPGDTNEQGFQVWRSTDGTNYTLVTTTTAGATTFNNTGLNIATTYYYKIRAHNISFNSTFSSTAGVSTPAPPAFTSQPADQSIAAGSSAAFTVAASGSPAYQWQRMPAGANSWSDLGASANSSGTTTPVLTVSSASLGMNGDQFRCVATNNVGSIASSAARLTVRAPRADFNSDGQTDILWQNRSTGDRFIWLMNGTSFQSEADLGIISSDWSIAGTADFNGDGQTDILWQNSSTGECMIWLMDGTTFLSSESLGMIPAEWLIAGTGDFNGDGQADILWQNAITGERSIWLMNHGTLMSGVSLGVVSPDWAIVAVADFNADGRPDLLWENMATGSLSLWLMNGTSFASGVSLGVVAPQFEITGAGDFNGDDQPDILWTNIATGERGVWLMNGTTISSTVSVATVPLDWILDHPVPTCVSANSRDDFNGDFNSDILWQNQVTGERSIWLMNGRRFAAGVSLGVFPTDWSIAAAGDFSGDGKTDIVWQNTTTGERSIWLMNGGTFVSGASLGVVPTDWSIAGTGDFNGDGQTDIVWQNMVTGKRSIWLMDGVTFVSGISLGAVPAEWSIVGAGDFNGDGKPDLVWQNTITGECSIWLMNGGTFLSGVSLGVVPAGWSIAGTGDFNGDGKVDIIWQNTITGERSIWLMNGTSFLSGISLGVVPVEWSIRN